jgi:thiamine biosynthesis lipoprotein
MDTYCTITVHGDNISPDLLDEAFNYLKELEALFSISVQGSDVWRINHAGGEPVVVDTRTIEVIKAGLEFGKLSDGMFDITIGRVSQLWDFGGVPEVPSNEKLKEALATVDYRQVKIVDDTVRLENSDAWIDLGAIAKGYIAYAVAEFLASRDVSGALINLGGDVVAIGSRQDGNPWQIALRKPYGGADEWLGVIEVKWASVLASGIYERQFELDGVTYHHILDPNTGMPVVSDVVSAMLITETAIIGEGFSTIAVLTGSERAAELFEHVPGFIGAVLVLKNGELLTFGEVELVNCQLST